MEIEPMSGQRSVTQSTELLGAHDEPGHTKPVSNVKNKTNPLKCMPAVEC